MRRGQPGQWWVLEQITGGQSIPIFWTGEWVAHDEGALKLQVPVFVLDLKGALQFSTEADAIFAMGIFGLEKCVVPVLYELPE